MCCSAPVFPGVFSDIFRCAAAAPAFVRVVATGWSCASVTTVMHAPEFCCWLYQVLCGRSTSFKCLFWGVNAVMAVLSIARRTAYYGSFVHQVLLFCEYWSRNLASIFAESNSCIANRTISLSRMTKVREENVRRVSLSITTLGGVHM